MMIRFRGESFPSLVASVFRANDDFEGGKVIGTYFRGGSGIVMETELGVDGEDTKKETNSKNVTLFETKDE